MTDADSRFIYFAKPIEAPGPIKIGMTGAVDRRIRELHSFSPVRLEILAVSPGATPKLERALHDRYRDFRSHAEWFHPNPDLLAMIEAVIAGQTVAEFIGFVYPRLRTSPLGYTNYGPPVRYRIAEASHDPR